MQASYPNIVATKHSLDGKFGSKFVTCVVSGGEDKAIGITAYQATNQAVAMAKGSICWHPGSPIRIHVFTADSHCGRTIYGRSRHGLRLWAPCGSNHDLMCFALCVWCVPALSSQPSCLPPQREKPTRCTCTRRAMSSTFQRFTTSTRTSTKRRLKPKPSLSFRATTSTCSCRPVVIPVP